MPTQHISGTCPVCLLFLAQTAATTTTRTAAAAAAHVCMLQSQYRGYRSLCLLLHKSMQAPLLCVTSQVGIVSDVMGRLTSTGTGL